MSRVSIMNMDYFCNQMKHIRCFNIVIGRKGRKEELEEGGSVGREGRGEGRNEPTPSFVLGYLSAPLSRGTKK